jgi:hypothetical protein
MLKSPELSGAGGVVASAVIAARDLQQVRSSLSNLTAALPQLNTNLLEVSDVLAFFMYVSSLRGA